MADVYVTTGPVVWRFEPHNTPAKEWLENNRDEMWQEDELIVEANIAPNLIVELTDAGFSVHVG